MNLPYKLIIKVRHKISRCKEYRVPAISLKKYHVLFQYRVGATPIYAIRICLVPCAAFICKSSARPPLAGEPLCVGLTRGNAITYCSNKGSELVCSIQESKGIYPRIPEYILGVFNLLSFP